MIDQIFVYGSLAPRKTNEHILKRIGGIYKWACVNGVVIKRGKGANMEFSGISLKEQDKEVIGFLFISPKLQKNWDMIDEFEGVDYKRVITDVRLDDGSTTQAYVYELQNY